MASIFGPGTIYMVVRNDNLTGGAKGWVDPPDWTFRIPHRRRTFVWRGKKFNVPTSRAIKIGNVGEMR